MDKRNIDCIIPAKDDISRIYATPNPPHTHKKWELVFFLEGISTNSINERQYEASHGNLFLIGPSHVHQISFIKPPHLHQDVYYENEDIEKYVSKMPKNIASQILSGERVVKLKLGFSEFETVNLFLKNLLNPKHDFSNEENDLSCQKFLSLSLLDTILGLYWIKYCERHTSTPKWLLEFASNLQRPEVFSKRVSEIVSMTNYSHSQVGSMFKAYKGISLVDYLIEIRMDYAKQLLQVTNKSVLSISEDCGYNSLSTFIKLFREKNNCSPLQYRKRLQKENENPSL